MVPRIERSIFVACLGWLLPISSWGEAAFVQSNYVVGNGIGQSLPLSLTGVTAGNLLAVFATTGSEKYAMTCSDNLGNPYTTILTIADDAHWQKAGMCFAPVADGGDVTITVNFEVAVNFRGALVHEISGVALSGQPDAFAMKVQNDAGTTTDEVTSGSLTTKLNGDYVFSATVLDGPQNCTQTVIEGTGFTRRRSPGCENIFQLLSEDLVQSDAGSISGTFTLSSATSTITGAAAFKPLVPPDGAAADGGSANPSASDASAMPPSGGPSNFEYRATACGCSHGRRGDMVLLVFLTLLSPRMKREARPVKTG